MALAQVKASTQDGSAGTPVAKIANEDSSDAIQAVAASRETKPHGVRRPEPALPERTHRLAAILHPVASAALD